MARGLVSPKQPLSEEALAALRCGDIDELMRIKHRVYGDLVMMADADDDDDDGDDGDDDDDDGASGSDDDSGDDKKDKSSGSDDDLASRLEAAEKRMRAADKRADEAQKALKKKEDAEKDELTKAQDRVSELEESNKELTETVSSLRLENAFLTANSHTWHDADTALALARTKHYLDDVVDDEGDVDKSALKKALDRLAKEHAYLIKSEKKEEDKDDGPSGEPSGGRSDNQKDEKAKKQQLRNRFPVIR